MRLSERPTYTAELNIVFGHVDGHARHSSSTEQANLLFMITVSTNATTLSATTGPGPVLAGIHVGVMIHDRGEGDLPAPIMSGAREREMYEGIAPMGLTRAGCHDIYQQVPGGVLALGVAWGGP
jgi:hypothetical protein